MPPSSALPSVVPSSRAAARLPLLSPLPATLVVTPWVDPVVEAVGFDVRSPYVELFWLGVIGPTSTWLLRRLVTGFDHFPDGYELDLAETAAALGLSLTQGAQSPFGRALNRCVMFGAAYQSATSLAVRRLLPPLSGRHLGRLPEHLRHAHDHWVSSRPDAGELDRAATLADAMASTGDEPHQIERQLLSVGISPRAAQEATRRLTR
ncbi:MAG TPA: hypothetical protein PLV68_14680 [Ilumatobacteraceae bacterium]|nr:hypothetical protein [Ilumatobacteraceae bacterium]